MKKKRRNALSPLSLLSVPPPHLAPILDCGALRKEDEGRSKGRICLRPGLERGVASCLPAFLNGSEKRERRASGVFFDKKRFRFASRVPRPCEELLPFLADSATGRNASCADRENARAELAEARGWKHEKMNQKQHLLAVVCREKKRDAARAREREREQSTSARHLNSLFFSLFSIILFPSTTGRLPRRGRPGPGSLPGHAPLPVRERAEDAGPV